jgi:DNA polymerase-3 subunit epsilon
LAAINTDLERLETILRELKEAVVVCDLNARILLYNAEAKRLFRNYAAMELGQSLYGVCARAPIEHTLRMLKHRAAEKNRHDLVETDDRFVCATVNGTMLLHCHINKIEATSTQGGVFVFTFEDITRQITDMGRQGYLLDKMIKSLRAPMTNLSAAAENLKSYPGMAPEIRAEFENIIFRESTELTKRFASVVRESRKTTKMQWPLSDVHSADLIGCVTRRFQKDDGFTVTMTGVPLWLHADSYSLMLVLDRLVRFVHRYCCNVSEIDIEALLGDRRVYLDIVWLGLPIPQSAVDPMLEMSLPDSFAGMTVADVLARHDSEIWSQEHRREGYSLLRIPVPVSPRQWEVPAEPLPERTEFYDFSIAYGMKELGKMADKELSSLNYVVFDTEATGFHPAEGDEILSIAAVRIVKGRILSGKRFERIIKPQRPIPESSRLFLDITEEMVREEPPVEEVLPLFKSFVDDAVLVAHNGSFDMNFFRFIEDKSGVRFENPILDTLLLSIIVEKDRTDYTLEKIGRWLGVEVMGSRTTMGDCFVTAQIFLRLLELLKARGITTLGEVITASERVVEEKRQQFS